MVLGVKKGSFWGYFGGYSWGGVENGVFYAAIVPGSVGAILVAET